MVEDYNVKVAIIMCVYNGESHLIEQLDSICDQNIDNIDIWISDDGSSDNTLKILESYKKFWSKGLFEIKKGPQNGFAANFLSLLCNSQIQADFFSFCDQDDIWEDIKLSEAIDLDNTNEVLYIIRSQMYTQISDFINAEIDLLEALDINSESVVLPVVPMFHVCAWGIPYAAPMTGATIVFPGAGMDGASLTELIKTEKADLLLGVPTVWLGLLNHLEQENQVLESVERVVVGGSAAPISMIQAFDEKHNAFVVHAWGMTEMSPLGTVCAPTQAFKELPNAERYALQSKQGRPVFGVQLKIVDDAGDECKCDGVDFGRLLVKGPWIAAQYYLEEEAALDEGGWFDTGDVATIDPKGFMQIVDRKKDVIKSGGEWISSIELENAAIGHPSIQEACVIGVLHAKWDERPLLLIVLTEGASCDEGEILEFMIGKVAKWSLPDAVLVVDSLPHTATGKLLKKDLREEYKNFLIDMVD